MAGLFRGVPGGTPSRADGNLCALSPFLCPANPAIPAGSMRQEKATERSAPVRARGRQRARISGKSPQRAGVPQKNKSFRKQAPAHARAPASMLRWRCPTGVRLPRAGRAVVSYAIIGVPRGQPVLPWGRNARRAHRAVGGSVIATQRITSSAWKRNSGGMVRPSASAVFRLRTSSNLIGCSTGRSPGFAPRKILSTKADAREYR